MVPQHNYFLIVMVVLACLLAVSSTLAQDQKETGKLQGKVLFQGEKAPQGIVIADTVVHLEGEGLASKEAAPKEDAPAATLDQKDITFVPHVLPVMVGRKVNIKNSDAILHNVHTTSVENSEFNISQLPNRTRVITFKRPEIIHAGCDIHSQMSAYIVVLPNPFFTKARKDSTYTISGIPPGTYNLLGWHEKYGLVTTKVEIKAGETAQVDIHFLSLPTK